MSGTRKTLVDKIEVRRMGFIERAKQGAYTWVEAYAIFVNGRECQPWMTKREAYRLAKHWKNEGFNEEGF